MEIIRSITETDTYRRDTWMLSTRLFVDQQYSQDARAMALEINGVCVAVGTMRLPQLHDSHYAVQIASIPGEESGAAVRLLVHLMSLRNLDRPVIARGFLASAQLATMETLGARTIQMVPPSSIRTRERHILRRDPHVVTASSVDVETLKQGLTKMYLWTHENWAQVNVQKVDLIPSALGFPETVDLEASSIVISEDGEVQALALVFTDTDIPCLISETVSRHDVEGERIVEGCVRRSLDALASRSINAVEFDGHASDPHFFPNWMKLRPTGKWFRIVEVE